MTARKFYHRRRMALLVAWCIRQVTSAEFWREIRYCGYMLAKHCQRQP